MSAAAGVRAEDPAAAAEAVSAASPDGERTLSIVLGVLVAVAVVSLVVAVGTLVVAMLAA